MNAIGIKNGWLAHLIILMLMIFSGAVFTPLSAQAEQNGPSEAINKLNATLLEAMKGGRELGYEGRYKLLAPVIRENYALSHMARIAAGKHWQSFSEEDRDLYLKTYTEWTIASYAGRFDEFSGEKFKLISESAPAKGTITVVSKLTASNREDVEFNYQFRKVEGAWRIVDIRILGVSQLALTRVQFVSVLEKKGIQGLVSMLNGKIRDLSHGKG